jgi:hypothetical protein
VYRCVWRNVDAVAEVDKAALPVRGQNRFSLSPSHGIRPPASPSWPGPRANTSCTFTLSPAVGGSRGNHVCSAIDDVALSHSSSMRLCATQSFDHPYINTCLQCSVVSPELSRTYYVAPLEAWRNPNNLNGTLNSRDTCTLLGMNNTDAITGSIMWKVRGQSQLCTSANQQ